MGNIATHHILKLNQSPHTMQSTSSLPLPDDLFNQILPNLFHSLITKFDEAFPPQETIARWLKDATPRVPDDLFNQIIPNLFHSLITKFNKAFPPPPPETIGRWLENATPHVNEARGIVLLSFVCWCCLPVIISCIYLLAAVCWSLITGFLGLLRGVGKGFFNVFFWCGRSLKLMKAPGRGGRVIMPRDSFESDPRGYFRDLRAGKSAGKRKAESIGMGAGTVAGVAMLAWGVLKHFGA